MLASINFWFVTFWQLESVPIAICHKQLLICQKSIFSLPTFHFLDALWPWIDGTNGKTTNNNRDRAKNKAVGWAISHRFGFGGLVPFLARELVFTNFREWFVGGWNVRLQWEREEPNCLSAICPEREEPAPWSAACQEMVQAAIHYAGLAPQFRILLSASTGPLL